MEKTPPYLTCEECRRLVRELRAAQRADRHALRTRLRTVAAASGRDLFQFKVGWVFSIATMADEEMRALLDAHYPNVARANREREAHEAATGHSLSGWWILSQYVPDED